MATKVTLISGNGEEILPTTVGDQVKTQNGTSTIEADFNNYRVFTGMIVGYGGSTPPLGWLRCDGSPISRTTYANLFNAIGTTYGSGDGSTTFNLPNLLDRVPIGGQNNYALGASGGSKDSIVVSHNHLITQNVGGTFGYGGWGTIYGSGYGSAPGDVSGNITLLENYNSGIGNWAGGGNKQRGRNVYAKYNIPNFAMASAGSSGTGANMQPYLAINFIIKY